MESFKRSSKVATQATEDELIVLHLETGNYYTLNETGRFIWEHCSVSRERDEIIAFVASECGVLAEQIKNDIVSYLDFLCQENLLEKKVFH